MGDSLIGSPRDWAVVDSRDRRFAHRPGIRRLRERAVGKIGR